MVHSLRHLFAHTHILPWDERTALCPVMPAHDLTSVLVLTSGSQDASVPSLRAVQRRISRAVTKDGIQRIIFSGRDPLCRSDLASILQYTKERFDVETGVATDTLLFDHEAIESCLPYLDCLYIPLDAENESVNTLLRPSHQFSKVLTTLHDLSGKGVRLEVSTIVTAVNKDAVVGIARLIRDVVDVWRVFQCIPGRSGNRCFVNNVDFTVIIDAIEANIRGSRVRFESCYGREGVTEHMFQAIEC